MALGCGSCQPSASATTSSPEPVPAAGQRLLRGEGCSPCPQPSLPHAATATPTCAGEGDVAARILRGTLGTGTVCFSPAHFQILRGFCSDQPQSCQGRAQWLTQALQEATGKGTSSTSSPPLPPTQLCLALGPVPQNPGQNCPTTYSLLCGWKPKHRSPRRPSERALPKASHLPAILPAIFPMGSLCTCGSAPLWQSCLSQARSSMGTQVRGGQPSFHSSSTSLETLLLIHRQGQAKRSLCLAQAGPQRGYSSLWGLRWISWGYRPGAGCSSRAPDTTGGVLGSHIIIIVFRFPERDVGTHPGSLELRQDADAWFHRTVP